MTLRGAFGRTAGLIWINANRASTKDSPPGRQAVKQRQEEEPDANERC
jgi:hypothetical protein